MMAEPMELMKKAIVIADVPPEDVPLLSHIFTRENAEAYLRDAIR
jgi:hypothetical protein